MKTLMAILLIGILLVSGCVSSDGGTSTDGSGGPPSFPESSGSGKSVLPTGKVAGWGLPIEYPWE